MPSSAGLFFHLAEEALMPSPFQAFSPALRTAGRPTPPWRPTIDDVALDFVDAGTLHD